MPKPRLLWIPHTSWTQCKAQRPWFLIEGLRERFDIHIATWAARPPNAGRAYYANPLNIFGAMLARSETTPLAQVHNTGVPLPLLKGRRTGYPSDSALKFAQSRFQSNIR